MNFLLDTHVLLWWLFADRRLPKRARALIESPENSVQISVASLWETAIKASLAKASADPKELYEAVLANQFPILSIGPLHALAVASLPLHHGDPFDRILVAQAQVEGLTLLTHDGMLALYEVAVEMI